MEEVLHTATDGVQVACPPSLTIRLALEETPQIFTECDHESDEARLRARIDHHPDLVELLDRALGIRESWLRAA